MQSFFDPGWMDLGVLAIYGRVAGVNWVWTEHLTIFHALISILASVAFVEILYPQKRRESWVHGFWWVVNWIGFIGIYVVWEIMTTYDPGLWKIVSVLAIAHACPPGQGNSQTNHSGASTTFSAPLALFPDRLPGDDRSIRPDLFRRGKELLPLRCEDDRAGVIRYSDPSADSALEQTRGCLG